MRTKLEPSPFKEKAMIRIAAGKGPYENTREALSAFDLSPAANKTVLLKPNSGRHANPGDGITTHPQVVAAAIDAFTEAGAKVAVGESPISGVRALEAFESTGITQIAEERDCPLIDLDSRLFIKAEVPEGRVISELKVCPEIFEYDIIVSIPVMKTHMHTGVTLSVKNMKGCLWKRSKVQLHMLPAVEDSSAKPIDIAIADLSAILKPHFCVIDANYAMEGMGPSAGSVKALDMVIAGVDPFMADAVACRIMGLDAREIPHLRLGSERGYGSIDISGCRIEPADWEKLIRPFEKPPSSMDINFPGIKIFDKNSCSACQSTLLLFLKNYRDRLFRYYPEGRDINIAIGKGHESLPEDTLCVGNCTVKHSKSRIYVPGCPPVGSEILASVSGEPEYDFYDGGKIKK